MKIANDITKLIGATPLVRLNRITKGIGATIVAKLEFFNPLGSVKDRIGLSMIEAAERDGKIDENTVIVEPTSGNTGISLAFVCAAKGYKLVLTMPETMSVERRNILKALGAQVILTPGAGGMPQAVEVAEQIVAETPNAFIPQQFKNPANPAIHRESTALEIWRDTDGCVDIIVGRCRNRGHGHGLRGSTQTEEGRPEGHSRRTRCLSRPLGTTERASSDSRDRGRIHSEVMRVELMDEIVQVETDEAIAMARRLTREEGLFVGVSSGAAASAALAVASRSESEGKLIVVVLPDTGERYLGTPTFAEAEEVRYLNE